MRLETSGPDGGKILLYNPDEPADDAGALTVHVGGHYRIPNAAIVEKRINSYTKLVDHLQKSIRNHCRDDKMFCSTCTPARKFLREIGEGDAT